jgi:hypothetical protein
MQPLLRALVSGAVAFAVSASFASSASASSLTSASMNWSIADTGQSGTANMLNLATCNSADVTGNCTINGWTPGNGFYTVNNWTSSWDTDPFVTNNLNVTNNSASVMTFDVTVTLPIALTGPSTDMSGSLGITLTNTDTGGASIAGTPSDFVYQALIDGVGVRGLFQEPDSLSCSAPFCSTSTTRDFGVLPNSPETGPQANSTIAIRLKFNLSPGDSAGITSVFNIEASQQVPESASGVLFAFGLVAIAARRRRRA